MLGYGLLIEIMQVFISFFNNKWHIVSSAFNFPHILSSSNTAIPIFSVPRFPCIELVPAVSSSEFVMVLETFTFSDWEEVSEEPELLESLELLEFSESPSLELSLEVFSVLLLALSPPKIAVPSQFDFDKLLKNSPTVILEK